MKLLFSVFWLFLAFNFSLLAQSSAADTLSQARALRESGKLRRAEKSLQLWCKSHPQDAGAYWLRAQNEYWRKNFCRSRRYYQRSLALDPHNLYLKLDYAEAQLGMGRFRQSEKLLTSLFKKNKQDPHYQFVTAKKMFWSGEISKARNTAQAAKKAGSAHAPGLLREIELARSPWARFGINYATDTQPLESYSPMIAAGIHRSKWLDFKVAASFQQFLKDSTRYATNFELGNRFSFSKLGTAIEASLGLFQMKNQKSQATAHVELVQRLSGGVNLSLSGAEKPYLNTRSSLDTAIFFQQGAASLEWREPHGLWLKMGVQKDAFEDKNQISTLWAWALTPPLKVGRISAQAGYAFSYADAKFSAFNAEKSLAEYVVSWDSTTQIRGLYIPYFTPNKIKTHALLGQLGIDFSKKLSLSIQGKYGVHASGLNPYLYLDLDETNVVFIRREFQKLNFTPIEANATLTIRCTERVVATANYAFVRNFFYESQTAGMQVKIAF